MKKKSQRNTPIL